jgi:hypothetical protein
MEMIGKLHAPAALPPITEHRVTVVQEARLFPDPVCDSSFLCQESNPGLVADVTRRQCDIYPHTNCEVRYIHCLPKKIQFENMKVRVARHCMRAVTCSFVL